METMVAQLRSLLAGLARLLRVLPIAVVATPQATAGSAHGPWRLSNSPLDRIIRSNAT